MITPPITYWLGVITSSLTGWLGVVYSKSGEQLPKARTSHSGLGTPTSVINEENIPQSFLQVILLEAIL